MAAYFLSCRFTFPKQQMRRVLKAQGLAEGFDPNKRIKSCYHVTFKHRHIISATCKWVIHFGSFQCLPSVPEFSSTYYQSVPVFCVLHEDLLQRHCERKEHCLPPGSVSPGCWKEKNKCTDITGANSTGESLIKPAVNDRASAHTLGTEFYMLFLACKHWCLMQLETGQQYPGYALLGSPWLRTVWRTGVAIAYTVPLCFNSSAGRPQGTAI